MHAGSFIRDGERVEIRAVPAAGYSDPIYLDPLTWYWDGGLYRMWPGDKYPSRGGKRLHRYVWAAAFGPIPAGCHIHHRDGDTRNNLLANLECMPAGQHLSEAWHAVKRDIPAGRHFSETAKRKAAEWHASEEGRLWHSRHATKSRGWTKWKREKRACPECGVEFDALVRKSGNAQIYCTTVCKVAAYRARMRQAERIVHLERARQLKVDTDWIIEHFQRQDDERDGERVVPDGS
jgi:hypothetical protein